MCVSVDLCVSGSKDGDPDHPYPRDSTDLRGERCRVKMESEF